MKISRPRVRSAITVLALAILAILPARSASASMLEVVPSFPTLLPGQSETVSVVFTSSQAFTLGSADIEISFDTSRFSVAANSVSLGTLDPASAGFSSFTGDTSTGNLFVDISNSSNGASIANLQSGTLETFTLTALANAPLGGNPGDINLLATNTRGIPTAVYDINSNSIVINPAPTNGYDASNDGTVTIASASVPEPSSLILISLGGVSVLVASRLRKKARRPSVA